MEIIKKRESLGIFIFGELNLGDVFFSLAADDPDEPYIVTDESGAFSNGHAVNLNTGLEESFRDTDVVTKVKATLTIE